MKVITNPKEEINVSVNPAEMAVLQFVLADNGQTMLHYMTSLFDFALGNMPDCDENLVKDVIPATNHFLKILRQLP